MLRGNWLWVERTAQRPLVAQRPAVIRLEWSPLCNARGQFSLPSLRLCFLAQFHTIAANHSGINHLGGSILQKPVLNVSLFLILVYALLLTAFHPVISLLLRL